jgi:RNA-directed DNA polymerase
MTNAPRQSDRFIVPTNRANKAGSPAAEGEEGRERTKGNSPEQGAPRTQCRSRVSPALERVRQVAERDPRQRFTALLHHVYDVNRLRAAYLALKRSAAAGVDGETWQHYGGQLETNLRSLSDRLRRGAYRVHPVRRAYIPKTDGRLRPLGVPTLEDKIVQRAVVEVLTAIYEPMFLGFSYGFRPGRSPHQAVDALMVGIHQRKVNWVLDADIQGFFDTLTHEWLIRFVEHRIGDRRIVRLIQQWLNAGVLEDGRWTPGEMGTVQGGSISPLLANLYLHYVFDLWIQRWRRTRARGDVIVVRFADDFVVGFQQRTDAEQFLADLRERFARFGLTLHPDKTRVLDVRHDDFVFLGHTHRWRFNRLYLNVSPKALARIRDELRRKTRQTWLSLDAMVGELNPYIRGARHYFRRVRRRTLYQLDGFVNQRLARWWARKHGARRPAWSLVSQDALRCHHGLERWNLPAALRPADSRFAR